MNRILINYISGELIGGSEDVAINADDDLLGSGLVDSLGMMKLVLFIENEFQLKIPPEDMTIENFMTVECISNYLETRIQNNTATVK
ncbi:acyl carrier protein [Leptobacterium flavescens]|uniref:Acyl carrier protein n=1 Tax=Leptobacterium flavescens TaxID=472055 RepID=A0A6P0UK47_9FLAO|nr:acyl carrier protein [Leptobacterium flavescens]NER13675.1 acyl carrier protein [Leptobacterium flavescens]